MTGATDISLSSKDSSGAVPSVTSYGTDHPSLVPCDGSAASGSLPGTTTSIVGATSPSRNSVPASPSIASNATSPSVRHRNQDLLDTQLQQSYPRDRTGLTSSDDDHTEPSSETGNNSENVGYTRSDVAADATSAFGRLIEHTKKRLNVNDRRRSMGDDDGEIEGLESALICGYLQKLGRNGKWQARWFETDGECLTYYKSSKRVKLLATLDLAKVGSIVINTDDRSGTSFSISISDRPYRLRADSVGSCKDWVITLNRVKEARMHEGNVKLAKPTHHPPDLLDTYTPKVVVVANRQRTRAIDDDDIQSWENGAPWTNPANDSNNYAPPPSSRLARWQKPRNSLSRLARRLAKWARSIRKMGCVEAEDQVVLDPRLHPPGHDDKASMSGSKAGSIPEALSSDKSATAEKILRVPQDDEDDDIRHLS